MDSEEPSSGIEAIRKYMELLEREQYDECVEQFTEDVVYYHPTVKDKIRGRENLKRFFEENRSTVEGAVEIDHVIDEYVSEGDRLALKGHITVGEERYDFLAWAKLKDGEIASYLPIPRSPNLYSDSINTVDI